MANFKVARTIPKEYNWHQRKRLFKLAKQFVWDGPYLFKIGLNGLLKKVHIWCRNQGCVMALLQLTL